MTRKTSISDIAKSLGVSNTLVSLVINNKADAYGISAKTQYKVRAKIKELNYQPNMLARGFRTGKTNTIGLIVSDISNRFYARIARNIEDHAWNNGYTVAICSSDELINKEKEQIKLLMDRKVDGLIISSSQEDASFFNKLAESGLPHVLIDRTFNDMQSANVSVDNFGGARLAAHHLMKQGITKIAIMSITPEHISTIGNRVDGFVSALADAGITIPVEWHIKAPFDDMEQSVSETLAQLFRSGNMPEAIFTLNNNLTSACLKHIRELSVKIPDDIALIGFDDVLYFGFTQPSVTAIKQPVDLICKAAFDMLLKQMKMERLSLKERSVCLPVDIIIRESSIKQKTL